MIEIICAIAAAAVAIVLAMFGEYWAAAGVVIGYAISVAVRT